MVVSSFARRAPARAAVMLAAALVFLPACIPPRVHERSAPQLEGPAVIPGFARVRTIEFPLSSDGWMYSYRGGGLRPDVYIYPAASRSAHAPARLTKLESATLKRSLPARSRQGWIGRYHVLRDEPVVLEIAGRRVEGHRIAALLHYPDEEVVTYQYVFLWGSSFVRIRESHASRAVTEEEVERFARLLLAALPDPDALSGRIANESEGEPSP